MIRTQPWFTRWREAARTLKRNIAALYFAVLDPRTPWFAKAFAILIVAYALSPIDLIPDPIPILGYLDDLILLPIGIWFALKLIPPEVMVDARQRAADRPRIDNPIGIAAAAVIILLYALVAYWLWRYFRPRQ
jgi:uncharacterized membrane protein YkvA (DUF1232 family)